MNIRFQHVGMYRSAGFPGKCSNSNIYSTVAAIVLCAITLALSTSYAQETAGFQPGISQKEQEPAWLKALDIVAGGVNAQSADGSGVDPRVHIARNMQKVLNVEMSAEAFYRELAMMPMPDGLEPRHALMQVKRDLIRYRGPQGAAKYLGSITSKGVSLVEVSLLKWRRQVVFDTINEVIREFRGRDVVDGTKWTAFVAGHPGSTANMDVNPEKMSAETFKVFYSGVGSWPNEDIGDMKFAGDIDFSFISGNVELAVAMKRAFDAKIRQKVGMSPEHFDTPATAHGMADPEVFIGRHGQAFAENKMHEQGTIKRIRFGESIENAEDVSTKDAFIDMYLDAAFARNGLVDVSDAKWPTEPGISLEMLRHFEHDVMNKDVYLELESYMKAAKYMKRSFDALEKAGGYIDDADLRKLCNDLIENKTSAKHTQAEIIRSYYRKTVKPLPVEVKLTESPFGLGLESIKANQALVKEFYEHVRNTMWENAGRGFDRQLDDLQARIRNLNGPNASGSAARVESDLDKLREMMEVEYRVLQDSEFGVKEIPAEFERRMSSFRDTARKFYLEHRIDFPDIENRQAFKFIESQLKAGKPNSFRMAMAMFMHGTDTIHEFLDRLDSKLLNDLRGENAKWHDYLMDDRKLYWDKKVDLFVERGAPGSSARFRAHLQQRSTLYQEIEYNLNLQFKNNCLLRGVRDINQMFSRSVQASPGGQAMMKGLVAINLMQEIPAYAKAFDENGIEGLTVAFFRRRVPGGNVVENVIMGRYYRAVWDTAVTFIPPLALGEAAWGLGEYLATQTWDTYWSSELGYFYDELYDTAKFNLGGIENLDGGIQLTNWTLTNVTLRGLNIDVAAFIAKKESQIRQLQEWVQQPLRTRQENFPIEYTLDGFLSGDSKEAFDQWMRYDELLRENIYNQDPFLLMIDELKKNKNAGPKLLQHYQDLFFTRREEIKLKYFRYIKNVLESRRSSQMLALNAKTKDVLEKLEEVAQKLKIETEMDKRMEEDMGGTAWSFYAWIRDYFKGIKRELKDQPDIWSNSQESMRIAERYLRTYLKILQAREDAEKEYYYGEPYDYDARLLTGKYFLSGRASTDSGRENRWRSLRPGIYSEQKSVLELIKARYVDDFGLESDPESFDMKTLGAISDHDMWQEAWSYIAEAVKDASRSDEQQKLALQHRTFHVQERDRLLKEFEDHYSGGENTLLHQIVQLVEQAEAIAAKASAECTEGDGLCVQAGGKLQEAMREADRVGQTVETLDRDVKNFSQSSQQVIEDYGRCEEAGIRVGDLAHEAESAGMDVCNPLEKIRSARSDSEKKRFFDQVRTGKPKLRTLLQQANTAFDEAKTACQSSRGKFAGITRTIAAARAFSGNGGAYRILGQASRIMAEASDKLIELQSMLADIDARQKRSEAMADTLRRRLAPIKTTAEAKETLQTLDAVMGRMKEAAKNPTECIAKMEQRIESLKQQAKKLEQDLDRQEEDRRRIQLSLEEQDEALVNAAKDADESADSVLAIAGAYLERVEQTATGGALCVTMAEELMGESADRGEHQEQAPPAVVRSSRSGASEDTEEAAPPPVVGASRPAVSKDRNAPNGDVAPEPAIETKPKPAETEPVEAKDSGASWFDSAAGDWDCTYEWKVRWRSECVAGCDNGDAACIESCDTRAKQGEAQCLSSQGASQ